MSKLGARIATGLTLAAAALTLVWLTGKFAPGRVTFCTVLLLGGLASWELSRMGSLRALALGPSLALATLACGAVCAWWLFQADAPSVPLALTGCYVAGALAAGLGRVLVRGQQQWALFAIWLLPPLFSLVLVERESGTSGLLALVFLAKIGDNAGFFVGRALGKRRPFPNISPGKTVAGCVASLVAGVVTGALLLPLTLGERTLAHALGGALLGGLINLAAQAGDLSESWVKRRAGVKDSSALVGPAGGVLDVIDSLLFAGPVALLGFHWFF